MKILFLDESGDHNLTNIDRNHPLFVLAGCIMDEKYYKSILIPELLDFKKKIFDKKDIILHYVDYTRNQNGFERMVDKKFREEFYRGLNNIIKIADFYLVASIIDKTKHVKRYGMLAMDPYILSLEIIIERFILSLNKTGERGLVIAESRGAQLDNELELAFLNLKIRGTRFLRPKDIVGAIESFVI